jgi:hypothetical protein
MEMITIRPFQNGFERVMWLSVYGGKSAIWLQSGFSGCAFFLHDVIFTGRNAKLNFCLLSCDKQI